LWDRIFDALQGEPHRARVHQRNYRYSDQGCKKKADPEIHDRLNHFRQLTHPYGWRQEAMVTLNHISRPAAGYQYA
jgi:hypothetical protein